MGGRNTHPAQSISVRALVDGDGHYAVLGNIFGRVVDEKIVLNASQHARLQKMLQSSKCRFIGAFFEINDSGKEEIVILCGKSNPRMILTRHPHAVLRAMGSSKKKRKKTVRKPATVIPDPADVPRRIRIDPEKIKGMPLHPAGTRNLGIANGN